MTKPKKAAPKKAAAKPAEKAPAEMSFGVSNTAVLYATVVQGTPQQVDDGTHAQVWVSNTGNAHCVILPAGIALRPQQSATVATNGAAVTVESNKPTNISYQATGTFTAPYAVGVPNQRGAWASSTAYAVGDYVIAPTGDLVTPVTAFTSGGSYSASNWNIVVPAASYPGRELAAFQLATTLTGGTAVTMTGFQANNGDTSKDVAITGFSCSPTIGSRSVYIEAELYWLSGVTGSVAFKLYDTTAGTVLDQDVRSSVTAFATQAKARLAFRAAPAAGARTYAVKANGTSGALAIMGTSDTCSSFIRVTER